MDKKKIILILSLLIVILAAVSIYLITQIVGGTPDYECITNGEAAKMVLALEEDFESLTYQEPDSAVKDYLKAAVDKGIMADCKAEDNLTNKNLLHIMKYYGVEQSLFENLDIKWKRKNRAVSEENWFVIYDYIREYRPGGSIALKELTIVATPGNMEGVPAWTAFTDDGVYTFYNLFLDGYMDNRILAYTRGQEILALKEVVSTQVVYRNAWIYEGNSNVIKTYIDGIDRIFYPEGLSSEVSGVLADIHLAEGVMTGIEIKTDTINGKVLSVTNDYVEIEGYGRVPFDKDYRLYKNYGGFSQIGYSDILVGYELQDFIVAEGKICGAIVLYPFEVQDIRIILRNTGFESIYHESVEVTCDGDFYVMSGADLSNVVTLAAGDSFSLESDSELIREGRIRIAPVKNTDKIVINTIERSQGNPAYPGFLEISADETGLYIVNEVNLEQYLKLVVPSEMPASYGVEPAKVQAVCARSYAYNQLLNNDYMEYGAHIDDSTWYQVYNNTMEYSSSSQAVDDTCGQVMTVNGDVITAYYYSTSCGHGSDIAIWGQEPGACSYITAHTINPDNAYVDLTTNEAFYEFITNKNKADFDSKFALYRWKTYLTMEEINGYYKNKANVGEITSISVIERLAGGSVNQVVVEGTKGTYLVEGEMSARKFFGDAAIEWTNNNDKTFTMGSLPSGFFALNPVYEKNKLAGYEIIGGGYGHGLGMSQNGAYQMTKEGYSYEDILKFFYQGIEITSLY